MKIICTILSIILFLGIAFLVYIMQNNTLLPVIDVFPNLNSVIYSILIVILAFLSGYILNQGNVEKLKSTSNKQLRKAEKASINSQESLDKIDRLNAKIETLEVALQEALKKKN